MADHAKPTLTSLYNNFLTELSARIDDALKQSHSGTVTLTNPPTNAIRWNSASSLWQYNSGTPAAPSWAALAATYAINVATANAWATGRTITLTGDATGASAAWTGSGNISFATTLATVNSNVGSFGSASAVPVITVNAKGLITGVSTAALGTIATQAANNVALTGGAISGTALTLVQSTTAAPTVEGRVEWDTDSDTLMIGDGTGTKTFSPNDGTATYTNKTFSTGCVWQGGVISSTYGGTGVNNGGRTLTIGTNSGTLTFGAASKTLTINNSIGLTGTDGTTMTFPSTSATMARTDAAQTFAGTQTIGSANMRAWSASDTDIDALLPGSTFGALIEAPSNAHLVIGIKGNDSSDGLYVIDTNNGGAVAYNQLVLALTNNTFADKGSPVLLLGGAIGTPTSGTLTNCTGLPIGTGVSGLGTGVATFLGTPTSANLKAALTDETGSGAAVFANSPTLVTPTLGAASATSINGLSLGLAGGGSNLNAAIGEAALSVNTTGLYNTAVGYHALLTTTTAYGNAAFGYNALSVGYDIGGNTAIGRGAMEGYGGAVASTALVTGKSYKIVSAGTSNFTLVGAANNNVGTVFTATGTTAGTGTAAPSANSYCTAVGHAALSLSTYYGVNNSVFGAQSDLSGNYDNCTLLGYSVAVTGSNQVQLGNSSTTTYAYGAVQNRSDVRDKADIRDTQLGLSFICALRPVDFRWDMRDSYRTESSEKLSDVVRDGSRKRSRYHHGLIAQEVAQLLADRGIDFGGYQDHSLAGGDDVKSIGYEELIAPLIKAVQELASRLDVLESQS